MADKNLAASVNNGVASETGTTHGSSSGAVANTNDGNTGTYWKRQGFYNNAKAGDKTYGEFTIEIVFDNPVVTLNEVKYWIAWYNHADAGSYDKYRLLSCSLYYSSAWHEIGTGQSSPVTISGPWSNVTKIKIRMYTWTEKLLLGEADIYAGVTLYELEAWGTAHKDIGLRIYTGSSVVKVGCKDLNDGSHKLRVRKDGTTYGIELVATDDSQASGIHIYDGSAVKALPFVD